MTPPLKWHGGKHYLAERIIKLMPAHVHYVEPFFGGGAVMLAKNPEGISEVANDLNGWLASFWKVMANPELFAQFERHVQGMPFSQQLWKEAMAHLDNAKPSDESVVEDATAFFVACRQSMAGRMDSFTPLSRNRVRRGMNEQASAWMTAVEGLPAVAERMKRVVMLNMPAIDCIKQQDGSNTLFYLDPPYVPDSRTSPDVYAHEMTVEQHRELLAAILSLEGKVILSGYANELYDIALKTWNKDEFILPNNSSSSKKKEKKIETIWRNF